MRYPGMLRSDGSESEHYEDAQQVNSVVMALAPTLMQLRATNTTYINGNDPGSQLAPAVRRTTSKTQSIFTYFVLLLYNFIIKFWSD